MKRSSSGKMKEKSKDFDKDLFGRPIKSMGCWESADDDDLLIFTHENCEGKEKIAGFDMDGTLITTKSGKVFPIDTNDWKLLYNDIPAKLKKLYEDDYKIVIFTNQKGIKVKKVDKGLFKRKIEALVTKLAVPAQVFVAISSGIYRKPCIGMWNQLIERNDKVPIDKSASFYVGDAAGRIKTSIRAKKDHSCADRYFATNIGLKFKTPEQFFEKNEKEEPWGPPAFEPKRLFDEDVKHMEPEDVKLPSDEAEIIVMVGFPGSGKSTFSKMIGKKFGYTIVNRDTLGTWQKCVAHAKHNLKEGKRVIIDNTNPDVESRKRYIDLAKEMNVGCRCFKMECHLEQAKHNLRFRVLTSNSSQDISTMVLRMHGAKYQEPKIEEGFDQIIKVNFKPTFEKEEHRELFSMYLVE